MAAVGIQAYISLVESIQAPPWTQQKTRFFTSTPGSTGM